ncbi:MAG: chaperone [Alphaproteobacteria bacterium]|nr:chaperone [Alphaproteobacteria bacterium]MBL6777462.1 chaperone [Alphaproteobacteria bacterium]
MKRFYKDVSIETLEAGFGIALDGRALRTPAKTVVTLPSAALAKAVADEWAGAGDEIKPDEMPFFSLSVTVIDRVMTQQDTLRKELCDYAGNDVLHYRAGPEDSALDSRQNELWSPWVSWAGKKFEAEILVTAGLMPARQPNALLQGAAMQLAPLSDWKLGALYRAVTLSGSFILGLAFFEREIDAETLFRFAFLEELHQNETCGRDSEAEARQKQIEQELRDLERFLVML